MLFNSINFFVFFVVVVFLYFALPHKFRWVLLLISSYFFYMCWEPSYAILILTTTFIVYITGLLMHNKTVRKKKFFVSLSVLTNLGILFAFKYYNFFNSSMKEMFNLFGFGYNIPALNVLLPVGISFYTFQALGYTIDIYRGDREPEKHFGIFALYVSFFPQLVAGPIERSTRLLPQFFKKVEFDYERVTDGLKLMAWGFFQKLVIADRLGFYVNMVYQNPQEALPDGTLIFAGLPLLIATYFFAIQIYCDFSGYTDIAIGAAQVMGYELMPNFRRPYFSRTIDELWRRWHMSLIMWFRDYLYIPLGGNRVGKFRYYFNILLVFTLSGLWHGSQWTFVIWGAMNGVLISLGRIFTNVKERTRNRVILTLRKIPAPFYFAGAVLLILYLFSGSSIPMIIRILGIAVSLLMIYFAVLKVMNRDLDRFFEVSVKIWQIIFTFNLFALGAVFFRAKSLTDAWFILTHILGTDPQYITAGFGLPVFLSMIGVVIVIAVIHLIQEKGSIRQMLKAKPIWFRWSLYYILIISIFLLMYKTSQFIYFQF